MGEVVKISRDRRFKKVRSHEGLFSQEQKLLDYLRKRAPNMPTISEMRAAIGCRSDAGIERILYHLTKKGRLPLPTKEPEDD